jgi:hypothetical protein
MNKNLLITASLLTALLLLGCTAQTPTVPTQQPQQTIQPTVATPIPSASPTPAATEIPTPSLLPTPSPSVEPELQAALTAPTEVEPNKQYDVKLSIYSKTQNASSHVNEVIVLDNSMEVFKVVYTNNNYVRAPRWSLNIKMTFTIDSMLELRVKKTTDETASAFQMVYVNATPLER